MTWPFGMMRKGAYGVIYADPAWQFQGYSDAGVPQRKEQQHYETMRVEDMAKLPVWQLAAPDCALFMWGISSHIEQALWLGRKWGFTYSSKAFCWAKLNKNAEDYHQERLRRIEDQASKDGDFAPLAEGSNWFMGLGHSSRRNTEDCWLFTRGNPKRMDKGVRELIVSPIRDHSRKPDETYNRIERLFQGPYCELFARNQRPGWSSWGNETTKF